MSDDGSFQRVMAGIKAGDESAAAELFQRYCNRLRALARKRLHAELRRKLDPEDVLQSVYRSFFRRQKRGEFALSDWENLWSLLTVITIRKCSHQNRDQRRGVRDVRREVAIQKAFEDSFAEIVIVSREPTAQQAAILTETLEQVMHDLDEQGRSIVSMKLQGYSEREISEEVGRTERTVRRVMARVRTRLERLCASEEVVEKATLKSRRKLDE